jgi:WD40 repeat protein
MNLRDIPAGTVLIAAIVGCGIWCAKFPDALQRALPQLQSGDPSETPPSFVYVKGVCWSPDSRKLLSLSHGECGLDGPLVIHDLDNLALRMPLDMRGETVAAAVLAGDGRHVFIATHEGRLWWIGLESDERKLLFEGPPRSGFTAIASSDQRNLLAAAASDGSILLCDPQGSTPVVLAAGLKSLISDLRFSQDGCRLVAAGQDGWLCVWDLQSGQIMQRWKGHDQAAMAAAFLSGDRLISAGLDDTVRIWEISTGCEVWRGEFGLSGVTALAVSADGRTAAWGGMQPRVVVWDLENARKKYDVEVAASIVWDIQFSADARSLAVAGSQGMLRVYDAQFGASVAELEIGERL